MEQLLNQTETCDAKLISADYKELCIHRAVAAIASDNLRDHFFHKHPGSTCYKTECNSDALVQVVNFMYKGNHEMSLLSFQKFCRLHESTQEEAIDDWIGTMIDVFLTAKKLNMPLLAKSILVSCNQLLHKEQKLRELLIDSIKKHHNIATGLDEFETIAQHYHSIVSPEKKSINGHRNMESNFAAASILLFLSADKNVDGLCLLADCSNGTNNEQKLNYNQITGNHTFQMEQHEMSSEHKLGFLYSNSHCGAKKELVDTCKWDETSIPIWSTDKNQKSIKTPLILKIK